MVNACVLMGRLTAQPELRKTNSGKSVCSFTIAVERNYRDEDGKSIADFIDCVAWERDAEFVAQYFGKGSMIAVQGSIQTRARENSKGDKSKVCELKVDSLSFCGKNSG